MAYVNKRDRENAIIKVKIAFGKLLNCEDDSDAVITLREPDEFEVLSWREAEKEGGIKKAMEEFKSLLKVMMISHNLMEDENEKMTNDAVVDLIFSKTALANHVLHEWSTQVFRSPQDRTNEK